MEAHRTPVWKKWRKREWIWETMGGRGTWEEPILKSLEEDGDVNFPFPWESRYALNWIRSETVDEIRETLIWGFVSFFTRLFSTKSVWMSCVTRWSEITSGEEMDEVRGYGGDEDSWRWLERLSNHASGRDKWLDKLSERASSSGLSPLSSSRSSWVTCFSRWVEALLTANGREE